MSEPTEASPRASPADVPAEGSTAAAGRRGVLARPRAALLRTLPPTAAQRALSASVFAVTVGGGILLGSSTLYLTRVVGMSTDRVGAGLTVGAAIGLVAGPFAGHFADLYGPREVYTATMLCGAVATAGFVLVHSFWILVLVSLLTTLVGTAAQASRAPLIRAVAHGRPTWFLSYQRAITNVGIMVGVSIATIGIQLDSEPVYVGLILTSAATFLVASAVLVKVPHVAPLERTGTTRRWVAFADRPFLTATALNGLMSLHLAIPAFALPLWIVNHTAMPRPAVTGFILINGVLVVALQVRMSRGVTDPRAAARRMSWAGAALLVSMALIGLLTRLPVWAALLLLAATSVVYTLGELWHAAASFELAFGLAVPHAQGQYSGAFGLGTGAANAVAPAVLATVCLSHGLPGWLALGALLFVVGLLTLPVVRWAQRRRPADAPA